MDAAGNVFATGTFTGSANFGGKYHNTAGSDVYLVKCDANGLRKWSKNFGANQPYHYGYSVAVDGLGNVVITGDLAGTANFGGGPLTSVDHDIFLAKFDGNGVHQWSRRFGEAGDQVGYAVAVDGSGNVVVTGYFVGTVDFGGGLLTSVGGLDMFLAEFDANGTHRWSKRFGNANDENLTAVAVDGSGNVVITGSFRGAVNLGGATLTSAGGNDIFIAKFDANGTHQWSKRFGSTGSDVGRAIRVDGPGNIVVTGEFGNAVNFGGATLTSAGSIDVFIAKYMPNGAHLWSQRFGGTNSEGGWTIGVDGGGNVVVTGSFAGTVNLGGGPLVGPGTKNIFVARYDSDGSHQWSQAFGSATNVTENNAVAVDGPGNIVITGLFVGAIDFGGGDVISEGWEDIYLAKFGEEQPVPVVFTNFRATPRGSTVEVAWNVWSDDPLGDFALYRREETASQAIVVARGSAPAAHSYVDTAVEAGKTYRYELVIHTADGSVFRSPEATVTVAALTGGLEQNQPNPFNPTTAITYTLTERAVTAISVYNAAGELVVRLDEGEHAAGTHRVEWDGRDAAGRAVASGVYVYRLEGVANVGARKMVLLK